MDDNYRMYGLVPYNISPIQQGIQFGHAVVEYGLEHGKAKEYKHWAKNSKTFIILSGGTTNWDDEHLGTLNAHLITLQDMGVKCSTFMEPDLGCQLTAIVFLVDEKVYNKEKYPDFHCSPIKDDEGWREWKRTTFGSNKEADRVIMMREFLAQFRLA